MLLMMMMVYGDRGGDCDVDASSTTPAAAAASAAASRQRPPVGFEWGTLPSNDWGRAHGCLETTEVRGCASQDTVDALAAVGSV
jgi:hypothetical protein